MRTINKYDRYNQPMRALRLSLSISNIIFGNKLVIANIGTYTNTYIDNLPHDYVKERRQYFELLFCNPES